MLKNNILIIIFINLYIYENSGERISEQKCREFPDLSYILKPNPHVLFFRDNNLNLICIGASISKRYAVVSAKCAEFLQNKSISIQSDYFDFTVNEIFIHQKWKKNDLDYNIALIKSNQDNPYPACIWQNKKYKFKESTCNLIPSRYGLRYKTIEDRGCYKYDLPMSNSIICDSRTYDSPHEFPLQDIDHDKVYVYGVYIDKASDNQALFYSRLEHYIDWIEDIIWTSDVPQEYLLNKNCGNKSKNNINPWYVNISKKSLSDSDSYTCSGVVINQNTVLTAANCVYETNGPVSSNLLTIELDYNNNIYKNNKISVNKILINKNFDYHNFDNNIAILKLSENINFDDTIYQPICLLNKTITKNHVNGEILTWNQNLNKITQIEFKRIKDVDCMNNGVGFENNFCATTNSQTNSLNSGSGFIFKISNKWLLGGILSYKSNTEKNFVFIDIFKYLDWIKENL